MNLLVLSPFYPWPLEQGGKIRVFNLVRQLAHHHEVTLACLAEAEPADRGPLTEFCREVLTVPRPPSPLRDLASFLGRGEAYNVARYASHSFRQALAQLATRQRFDLVLVEFSLLWPYAGLFPGVPVVLDAHNVEAEIVRQLGESCRNPLKRLLYQREERLLRHLEEAAWRECALCLAVSVREQATIAAACGVPGKVESVPNGVDLERFDFQPKERPGIKVLFLGGMEYGPNLDAGRWFLTDVFPKLRNTLPAVEVDVVGRQLAKLGDLVAQPGVRIHENVPDVLPFFRGADLLAVPLRLGAGTRLKILEAMAAGLPVVATAKGCEGIAAVDGEHLLVADGTEVFARAVARLLADCELAGRLAHNARQLVTERYSWEELGARLEGLLAGVARVARGGSA